MLSELDETFNRASFEAVVREAVTRARSEFEQLAHQAMRGAVDSELDVINMRPARLSREGPARAGG